MADVKWIKITTDIFDDEKVLLIESLPEADSIIVIWFKLLCLAGKQNNSGVFMMNDKIAYTDEMLATIFRRNINTVRLAIQTFESFGMVEKIDNVITIPNWEKHQNLDQLEMAREQTRKRVAKHREKQKLLAENGCNVTETLPVTQCNADRIDKNRLDKNRIDKDIDIDIDKDIINKTTTTKRFKKPTVDEIKSYCEERNNMVNAEAFYDYYESKDWMIGKNRMKDWKAAVRTWERNTKKETAAVDPFDF